MLTEAERSERPCGKEGTVPPSMTFLVIERFANNDMIPVYRRLKQAGRQLPEGLEYIGSWVEPNFSRCFQIMQCSDAALLQQWVLRWRGLGVSFEEIVPVVSSEATTRLVEPLLEVEGAGPGLPA